MPSTPSLTRERVSIGARDGCIGYVYRDPHLGLPAPCIVMGHGFGGTQDGVLAITARHFAAQGFLVVTFDYRGFGESPGEPRQVVDVGSQLQDWRSAIAFVRRLPSVQPDKVALWGSSLGGGHALTIGAEDASLAAIVAQVPFIRFPRKVEGRSGAETAHLLAVCLRDWVSGKLGRARHFIKLVGRPGELAVMASEDAVRVATTMHGSTWRNEVAPGALIDLAYFYRPGRHAHRIKAPVLFSLAQFDLEAPTASIRPVVLRVPLGEMRLYPCNHYEIYEEPVRRTVLTDQVSFLRLRLQGPCMRGPTARPGCSEARPEPDPRAP